jgi:hypothetical protein
VLELANRVQEQLDMTALAVYLGTNHDNETDEEQLKISKQHQNDKATLVKLLAAKVKREVVAWLCFLLSCRGARCLPARP